VSGKMIR